MIIGNREFDTEKNTYIMGILNAVSYTHLTLPTNSRV